MYPNARASNFFLANISVSTETFFYFTIASIITQLLSKNGKTRNRVFFVQKVGQREEEKRAENVIELVVLLLAIAALGSKTSSKSQKDYSHFVLRLKMAEYNFSFSLFLSLSLYVCMPGLLA